MDKTTACLLHRIYDGSSDNALKELVQLVMMGERNVICVHMLRGDVADIADDIMVALEEEGMECSMETRYCVKCYDCFILLVPDRLLVQRLKGFEGSLVDLR